MIEQFSWAVVLIGGVVLTIIFCFVKYVFWQKKSECQHMAQATFDSYYKKVCIDCGAEFSTAESKK